MQVPHYPYSALQIKLGGQDTNCLERTSSYRSLRCILQQSASYLFKADACGPAFAYLCSLLFNMSLSVVSM